MSTVAVVPGVDAGDDLLMSMAAQAPASKSKKKPKPQAAGLNDSLRRTIDQFVQTQREADSLQAKADAMKQQIIAEGRPLLFADCNAKGKFQSSLSMRGDVVTITLSLNSRYSTINTAEKPRLVEVFGQADADRYFVQRVEIKLKEESANDPAFRKLLQEKLGAALVQQHFSPPKVYLAVTEAFHHELATNPVVREKADDLLASEVIKPYTPTVKPA